VSAAQWTRPQLISLPWAGLLQQVHRPLGHMQCSGPGQRQRQWGREGVCWGGGEGEVSSTVNQTAPAR
jgi:hypothetical protein